MKAGVYKITNTVSSDFYIGSTIDVARRWREHKKRLRSNSHYNKHLQDSYNRGDALRYELLEECDNVSEREQYYIDTLNPMYNIKRVAVGSKIIGRKWKNTSKTTFQKGHIQTEKNKLATSLANKGHKYNLGRKPTIEEVAKNYKPIAQYDLQGNHIADYVSIKDACEKLNTSDSNIGACLRGVTKTAKGFIWKYIKS